MVNSLLSLIARYHVKTVNDSFERMFFSVIMPFFCALLFKEKESLNMRRVEWFYSKHRETSTGNMWAPN